MRKWWEFIEINVVIVLYVYFPNETRVILCFSIIYNVSIIVINDTFLVDNMENKNVNVHNSIKNDYLKPFISSFIYMTTIICDKMLS